MPYNLALKGDADKRSASFCRLARRALAPRYAASLAI